ncbi:phosphotransferase family protein [Actinoplanes sp. CA-142083]|uniref:phosphotransferase family protein n=1 Tax=Actinoplanes sp. CA-142083 TaxID=3239903 RepID=UPI003D8A3091
MEPTLRDWIEADALPGRRVALERTLTGGYSNHNVLVTMDDGRRFVLRRYLGANRCAVEAALARRLAGVIPVPEVVAADETGKQAGEPAMLSTFVEGAPVGGDDPGSSAGAVGGDRGRSAGAVGGDRGRSAGAVGGDRGRSAGAVGGDRGRSAGAIGDDLGREVGFVLARLGSVTFDAPGFFANGGLTPDGSEPTLGLDAFVDRCLREGNAQGHLTAAEQNSLRRYASEAAPAVAALAGSRQLVHADYNPKNILAVGSRVTAVLDFEYAFSSSPLFDVGNMLRFPRRPGFEESFVAGFRDGGGELPPHWRELSQALDLYSLADFLTRPVEHRYFGRSLERIRALLAGG